MIPKLNSGAYQMLFPCQKLYKLNVIALFLDPIPARCQASQWGSELRGAEGTFSLAGRGV